MPKIMPHPNKLVKSEDEIRRGIIRHSVIQAAIVEAFTVIHQV